MLKVGMKLSYLKVVLTAVILIVMTNGIGPQLSEAKYYKHTAQLIDSLVLLRNSLEYYRAMNNGLGPPVKSFAEFKSALASNDENGKVYLKQIPVNPFNGLDTVRFDGAAAGANRAGWRYDTKSGQVQADNDAACAQL